MLKLLSYLIWPPTVMAALLREMLMHLLWEIAVLGWRMDR